MIAPAGFDKRPQDDGDDELLAQLASDQTLPQQTHCDPEELQGSHVLSKASSDCWTYLIVMRNGAQIVCSEIEKRGEFLHLSGIEQATWPDGSELAGGEVFYGRGMEVRLDHISIVVDQDS